MKIATILDLIDLGGMALPEFQRGYVWNRDQVRGLMQSLYGSGSRRLLNGPQFGCLTQAFCRGKASGLIWSG